MTVMDSIFKKLFSAFFPIPNRQSPKLEIHNRALSIRQPHAELILRGKKRIECRKSLTNIRGRVYIYASLSPAEQKYFDQLRAKPGDFPTGVIVGTVEIIGCEKIEDHDYEWELSNPIRFETPIEADNKAQPTWFIPFNN